MDGTQVVVYIANDRQQAFALRNRLTAEGITSSVEERDANAPESASPQATHLQMRVLVDIDDAVRARELAEQFDQQHATYGQQWEDWPGCPHCETRRQTFCPICDVSGSSFPIADFNAAAKRLDTAGNAVTEITDGVLLMCETCDEAFAPKFYRRCAQCGHEFADGIDVDPTATIAINNRVVVAAMILAGIAIGLFAYFQWVLN
jgi:hypothetical protein